MDQTREVVRLVREVLSADVVGAYLHGSAAFSGLRPRSDVDVFVVSGRHLTEDDRRRLVSGLLEISGPDSLEVALRPVELTIVAQADVRPWRYPPRCEFQYGEWLRTELERGDLPQPESSADLAPLVTMVLMANAPLFGPQPAEVLDPVPHEDLRRAMVDAVPELLKGVDEDDDTRNVLLTFARVWTTLATGVIRSKDSAADWALERLPAEHHAVLSRARAIYLGERQEHWDDVRERVRPHVDYVVAEIRRLAG